MAANIPVIRFRDVEQIFTENDGRPIHALTELDFEITRHEFVSVLGPSGCRKSTLLRLVSGLIHPSEGVVEIYGMKVTELCDEIGIVFQKPTLLPWFNVLNNVTFPMRHKYGRVHREDEDRAHELLALVGLGDFAQKRIDELSGGM
ncbi:ATP-binding cassette domain-containing protein [Breoghania sp.]|uniref:ATP-binding cassette domain-containing protein n=1 Tax=Breoghania sp. TaxID=2065378 RepID=UPI00261CEF05|nr:ATP-binding cassette domain-containing protein [Breoghania sp.]MDJ0929768.1 ATP-binding cassette domain-containing protein [Breoghania sp.]